MAEQKVERILLLDDSQRYLPVVEGVGLIVIEETSLGGSAYRSSPDLEANIKRLTEGGEVDYVVIGNNTGAGFRKADAVAEGMRAENACIVWHIYTPGSGRPYEEIGYRHFMSRTDLRDFLGRHIREKHQLK